MPSEPENEEDYASEEDSDFAPEAAQQADSSASENEGDVEPNADAADTNKPAPSKRKRQSAENAEDAGFENSGDEAIIEKGKKKRRKKGKDGGDAGADDDEAGGEGGMIKTRSMRATEKAERKLAAVTGPVTIDVDALWAQMTSESTTQRAGPGHGEPGPPSSSQAEQHAAQASGSQTQHLNAAGSNDSSDMIRIKRTYNFAGKVHTEEKFVARDSAEAKLYLASLGENGDADDESAAPKRMPRKAFRSAFEPIVEHVAQRGDLDLGISVRLRARELANQANAKKLNTVEKSRMDWAGYVDKEGIKDELALAGKSKDSFAARQDFLARTEARREDDARKLRLAEKV